MKKSPSKICGANKLPLITQMNADIEWEIKMGDFLHKLGKELMIFDGAYGTEMARRGLSIASPELLNLTAKDEIANIHKSYIDAGCDFITTNTFGANKTNVNPENLQAIIGSAIELAKRYRTTQYIIFDIGPLRRMSTPSGNISFDEAYRAFQEVVLIARDHVDGFLLETFYDLEELRCAMLAVKENSDKPVFTTMTFGKSGLTYTGASPREMAELMSELGAAAIGANCSFGPESLLPVVEEFVQYSNKPLIMQPNLGLPQMIEGKAVYNLSVEDFYKYMNEFYRRGVSVLGGCCGTTPEYIRAIAALKGRKTANG